MGRFSSTLSDIKYDFPNGKVSFKLFFKNYFFNPSFRILLNHRIGKYFFQSRFSVFKLIGIYYKNRLIIKRNCDISYYSSIGRNLKLPHPIGIVIGEGVVIKDNVMIFQQVTLGSHGKNGLGRSYPIIESGVKIYSGSKIIGGVMIGENAVIGANSVVNINIPPNSTGVGLPCKILAKQL